MTRTGRAHIIIIINPDGTCRTELKDANRNCGNARLLELMLLLSERSLQSRGVAGSEGEGHTTHRTSWGATHFGESFTLRNSFTFPLIPFLCYHWYYKLFLLMTDPWHGNGGKLKRAGDYYYYYQPKWHLLASLAYLNLYSSSSINNDNMAFLRKLFLRCEWRTWYLGVLMFVIRINWVTLCHPQTTTTATMRQGYIQ